LLHPVDGRVFFVIPWMGKTLIGTTDTLCEDAPDSVTVIPEEMEYLLSGHNHYFSPALKASDILNSFVGLRPLIRAWPGVPSSLSREFQIFESPSGLLSIAGGKYTTYRRMAEITTDKIASRLGRRRHSQTRDFRLNGAPEEAWKVFEPNAVQTLGARYGIDSSSSGHLVRRYGRCAANVAVYLDGDESLAKPVMEGELDLQVEFVYQREHEMAIYPADYLLRRTRLGLFHPELLHKGFTTAVQDE
jgi:glycerol-3-phosphate dehydrogenase